jgi:hypothetical protein
MANTIAQIQASDGLTLTLKLYADDSDTIANGASGDTLTERTNDKGTYRATVTEALAGVYRYRATDANDVTMARGMIDMVDDTATHEGYDPAPSDMALESTSQAIVADTDELQINQGDWLTATGFSTHTAADVYTEFGDGANLTALTTATGFSTHSANDVYTEFGETGFSTHTAADVYTAFSDGANLTALTTATGFSTHSAADVYTEFGDGSSLTTLTTATGFSTINPDNSGIAAIKTKTDQLVFTVANQVDSNALTGGGSGATASEVRIEMDANSTKLTAIVADTNELQTDWADGGRLDLLLDAIPTTPMRGTDSAALAATALSTAVWTGVPTGFLAATFPTTLASTTNITGGTITTCTTNSDMRGTDGANTVVPDAAGTIPTGMALETTSQTILTDTGTTIPALIPTAGAIADQVWDEATAGHTTSGTYGGRVVRSTNSKRRGADHRLESYRG